MRKAYLDMRFHLPNIRQSMRLGDKVGIYILCLDWRLKNKDTHLTIIDDGFSPGLNYCNQLPVTWLFDGLVDEYRLAKHWMEELPKGDGESLYYRGLWEYWSELHQRSDKPTPRIRPTETALAKVRELTSSFGDRGFMILQPLFDAGYNVWRNAPLDWWADLGFVLKRHLPLAVIGDKVNAEQLKKIPCHLPLWQYGLDAMESLAAVSMAKVFLGGETGFTLWAPVLGVPTVGAYWHWGSAGTHDSRPISFTAPVVGVQLQGDLFKALDCALKLFSEFPSVRHD